MKKVLITGGAGFIGSHLVEKFIQNNFNVVVLDNLSSGKKNNLKNVLKDKKFKFVRGDINNKQLVLKILNECEGVIHCAVKNVRMSLKKPLECYKVNSFGTINLLECSKIKKIKKFIYCSSSEVYGNNPFKKKLRENTNCYPTTIYGASKLAGEYYTLVYKKLYGLNSVVLRPFNAYGERAHESADKAEVIYRFVSNVLRGKRPYIFGNGKNSRDFTYVKDITDIFFEIYLSKLFKVNIVNIGFGKNVSIIDLLEKINKLLKKNIKPIFLPSRPGDVYQLHCDNSFLKKNYKIFPKTNIKIGIKLYTDWLKNNSFLKNYKKINW